ncbi:MAG TPA: signal peptidase I [Nocardioidaceae bacterium]|nr:signal peptidase I [Nocardioidaceae bacterium]
MRVRRVAATLLVLPIALALVAAAAVAVLAKRVQGSSMSPTLADAERILVLPGTSGSAEPLDVVLLHEPGTEITIVKRVIAVEGDRVKIVAGRPVVEVQSGGVGRWVEVAQPSWRGRWTDVRDCCDASGREQLGAAAMVVPPGKLFVMGDNPDGSRDSREFGWAELASVQGRVWRKVWPL